MRRHGHEIPLHCHGNAETLTICIKIGLGNMGLIEQEDFGIL